MSDPVKALHKENVLLKVSLLEKQSVIDEFIIQLNELKGKLMQTENELELAKYNNTRLAKRIESTLQNFHNEKTSALSWLSPKDVWSSIFGKLADNSLAEKLESAKVQVNALIEENQKLNLTLISAHNDQKAFEKEKLEFKETVNVLVARLSKRHKKSIQQKAIICELNAKVKMLEECIAEFNLKLTTEKAERNEVEKKYKDKIKELNDTLSVVIENTPNMVKEKESVHGDKGEKQLIWEESESVEENICKLLKVLKSKLKLYKSFTKREAQQDVFEPAFFSEGEEIITPTNEMQAKHVRNKSFPYELINVERVEEMLTGVECPFKVKALELEKTLTEERAKSGISEKKAKLLDRMLSTQFACPKCKHQFILTKGSAK